MCDSALLDSAREWTGEKKEEEEEGRGKHVTFSFRKPGKRIARINQRDKATDSFRATLPHFGKKKKPICHDSIHVV